MQRDKEMVVKHPIFINQVLIVFIIAVVVIVAVAIGFGGNNISGAASKSKCVEYDVVGGSGKNYYKQGEMYVNGKPQSADSCEFLDTKYNRWLGRTITRRTDPGPGRLVEMYCEGGVAKKEYVTIPVGYYCEAGKFVADPSMWVCRGDRGKQCDQYTIPQCNNYPPCYVKTYGGTRGLKYCEGSPNACSTYTTKAECEKYSCAWTLK